MASIHGSVGKSPPAERRSLPLIYSLVSRQTAHLPEAPREAGGGVGTETPGGVIGR